MKKINKKGFTLAELLIVVAIIAVLVAIAIPVFTAQLDKAKLATATANVRSVYAEYIADCLSGETKAGSTNGEPVDPTVAGFEGDDYYGKLTDKETQGCDITITGTTITIKSPKGTSQNTIPVELG